MDNRDPAMSLPAVSIPWRSSSRYAIVGYTAGGGYVASQHRKPGPALRSFQRFHERSALAVVYRLIARDARAEEAALRALEEGQA